MILSVLSLCYFICFSEWKIDPSLTLIYIFLLLLKTCLNHLINFIGLFNILMMHLINLISNLIYLINYFMNLINYLIKLINN